MGEAFGFKPPVAGGPMFQMLYQIPTYLNPEDRSELDDVEAAVRGAIRTGSATPFTATWPGRTANWGNWYDLDIDDADSAVELAGVFFDFIRELWDSYRATYTQKIEDLPFDRYEAQANAADIFARWRHTLGVEYPYDAFEMILCPEIRSLASSVGPDAITFGLHAGLGEILPSAIHEIGVRYSNLDYLRRYERTAPILAADYVGMLRIIEAETCYQKMRHFPEIETDRFLSPSWEALVAWRRDQDITFECYYDHLAGLYARAGGEGLL